MIKDTASETTAPKSLLSETAEHQILAEVFGFVADRPMAQMSTNDAVPELMNDLKRG